jgi:putative nucleotide binding protein|tara:strand:- start:20447 stop:21055 length:609 start_codon:yes stop_codon:yes gene_type:complete
MNTYMQQAYSKPMEEHRMESTKEENGIVLDFLPNGYPMDERPMYMKTPIAQAIGKEHFVLLELVPKKGIHLQPYEEVYIGEGKRDKIHHIVGKLPMSKLTRTAQSEMEFAVKDIVEKSAKKFIDFFNNAKPLSTRMHQIELLPGVGKKHMWEIINARDEKPFDSFDDIKKRVKLMPDPEKIIIKRIVEELEGTEKHMLFVDV